MCSFVQKDSQAETSRAFGTLFIYIAIAIAGGAVFSEIAIKSHVSIYGVALIWLASFVVTFGVNFRRLKQIMSSVRMRMNNSISWPIGAKIVNGVCWATPFAMIGLFPSLYQYLILAGIGSGNLSTYLLLIRLNGIKNMGQMIVGVISFISIPVSIWFDTTLLVSNHDLAVFMSRILISVAYGVGGIYTLLNKS
jgi:hypothetical protein